MEGRPCLRRRGLRGRGPSIPFRAVILTRSPALPPGPRAKSETWWERETLGTKLGHCIFSLIPPPRSSHSLLTATQRSAPAETPRPKKISNRGIKPLRPPQKEREAKEEESSRNTGRRKRTTGLRRSAGGCLSVPTAATGS